MNRLKCSFCNFEIDLKNTSKKRKIKLKIKMANHYKEFHNHLIPEDTDPYRYTYYTITGKYIGSCIICKSGTEFNIISMKYTRFCKNPECFKVYRDEFKNRMITKHGKIHLLNDPEVQKKMLSSRSISGKYEWKDGSIFHYVGSYELDFMRLMNEYLNWPSSDIMFPSPHVYQYLDVQQDGSTIERMYIPDAFIPSLSLEIEIKDGGGMKNINPDSRRKDQLKHEMMMSVKNHFNYIRIENKNYEDFLKLIEGE